MGVLKTTRHLARAQFLNDGADTNEKVRAYLKEKTGLDASGLGEASCGKQARCL